MNGFVGFIQVHPFSATNLSPIKSSTKQETNEIRVCTSRTCRRQGSTETLQILSAIAPPNLAVNSCGCLGRCGAGPNLVALPSATFVSHCATAARAAEIMEIVCGFDSGGWRKSLEALSLRKKAEIEMGKGDFAMAESLLSQAIDLNLAGGIHIAYKDRCVARLAMNNAAAALADAIQASTLAPKFPEAYICKGDALMVMEQFEVAGDCYSTALDLDPSVRRSKSFKARIAKLQEKLIASNLC